MSYIKYENELKKLQDEVRGINVEDLSEKEFAEYSKKASRIHELMNILYY